jgi:magnesium transporter
MSDTAQPDIAEEEIHALKPDFVRSVIGALDAGDSETLIAHIKDLHAADVADLIELLRPDERRAFIDLLGPALDINVLHELDESLRDEVLEHLSPEMLAKSLQELSTDDAVYLLADLKAAEQREILRQLPKTARVHIERGLQFPEYTAGRLMQHEAIVVPSFWTVGQTLAHIRESTEADDDLLQVFVVDPAHHPIGTLPLSRLLRAKSTAPVSETMVPDPIIIPADMDQEEVAYQFEHYHLMAAPVVDKDGRFLGVLTVDDVLEIVHEEAEEDILKLGGVIDKGITDSVLRTSRGRMTWLVVNLGTAILASTVISLFDATIEEMVALAILMPIVASMGGNAGTQTMTVTVRALATRDLVPFNAARIILREILVGVVNGSMLSLLMGTVAWLWFGDLRLGLVLGSAMIVNSVAAGLFGILVPLGLDKLDIDPATASSVFVTTVTDVVGFFVFLGLAAWLLL